MNFVSRPFDPDFKAGRKFPAFSIRATTGASQTHACRRNDDSRYGMMAAASLELSGISKRYPGVQALNRVDFECRPGEIHAVLGENGSGKSTLLGIAAGAVAADEGGIAIMGNRLPSADPLQARRLGLAVVYQDDSLVRELSVTENLLLGAVDGPKSLAASGNGRQSNWRLTASASRPIRWSDN